MNILNDRSEIELPTTGYDNMQQLYSDVDESRVSVTLKVGEKSVEAKYVGGEVVETRNRGKVFIYNLNIGDEVVALYDGVSRDCVVESVERLDPPEIGLCSLGGICVDHIKDDEEYESAMYYALKMIDRCIDMSEYVLPHLGITAKARRSAGIGIVGLAHYMASRHLSYSSQEGRDEVHRLAEKHMYYAIRASLKLSKEYGVAPWMYKTKWVDGWLPIDTYNRNVDRVSNLPLQYDWEALRNEIVCNGGIRNSVLIAHMPSESSSLASGTTNSLYPIRSLTLLKGDASKVTYWAAPEGEKLSKWYDIAWNVPSEDLIKIYGIIQKFTDQGISADLFADVSGGKLSSSAMIKEYLNLIKYGMKSRYYMNTLTTHGVDLHQEESIVDVDNTNAEEEYCESCTL